MQFMLKYMLLPIYDILSIAICLILQQLIYINAYYNSYILKL